MVDIMGSSSGRFDCYIKTGRCVQMEVLGKRPSAVHRDCQCHLKKPPSPHRRGGGRSHELGRCRAQ
jgi:hypothetical protein